jgi:hypothetical protein
MIIILLFCVTTYNTTNGSLDVFPVNINKRIMTILSHNLEIVDIYSQFVDLISTICEYICLQCVDMVLALRWCGLEDVRQA